MADKELYQHYQQCSSCKTSFETCDPRILPCLHSVCLICFEKLSQQETSMCPCCSENLDWTAGLAEHLPTDHHRRSILEYINIRNDKLDVLICKKCGENKASFRCKECKELLCQNCKKEHCRFIKDHTVISLDEVKNKDFRELISPLICESHKFPLQKYCYSDQKAICNICELTDHHKDESHMVENISTVYSDKKQELELNIVACKEKLESVIDQKANIANEITNLNETRNTLAGEIDASINNLIEALGKKRKELKDDLNSAIESCSGKWNAKLKALTDIEHKQKEALSFAEKSLDFFGQEDFCQAENIISDRLQSLAGKGKNTYFKSSELKHITFARGDVGMLNQLIMTNNWLSLIEFKLYVADEIRQHAPEDKIVIIGQLKLCVANGQDFSSTRCPLQIVVKEKSGKETGCNTVFDESEKCFKITSELLTSGDYSLEVLLKNKCLQQHTFKFIAEFKGERTVTDKKPYGTKQRLDELRSSAILEQEMQCPTCNCPFSFNEETAVPRVLPCLHTIDTRCITTGTNNGAVQCPVCKTKHVVKDGNYTCFAVDETRRNLSIYGNLRLEERSYLHCKEHKTDRATFMCQKCYEFLCEKCSRNHSGGQHPPLIRVPELEVLKETPISKLCTFYPCDKPGHEQRMLELFCVTCEKLICHECNFDSHRDHKVDKIKAVYDARYAEMKTVLKQAEITKAKADSIASEIRDELELLRKSQDQELLTIRKVFNNCKTALEARKKSVETELADIASKKRDKMQSQLTEMEDVAEVITISDNRALDLIEFSSEVSFLRLYETLKRRLKSVSESCKQTRVCENGLIKYLDDNLPTRIVNVTKQPGRLWSCNLCLPKTKHWISPAVAKQEGVVLKLQFLDYEEKTTSSKYLKDFMKIDIIDSKKQRCTDAVGEIAYGDEILSVSAIFPKAGSYKIMVYVLETPISKDGYQITVQAEKIEQKPKENNKEKDKQDVKTDSTKVAKVSKEQQQENLKDGDRVIRGPTWKWGDQDGGIGSTGTVKVIGSKAYEGWVQVTWDNGDANVYRKDDSFVDVILAPSVKKK